MTDTTRDLLVRGIAAAKSHSVDEARHYLEWLLRLDSDLEEKKEAWFWLSEISSDPKQKRAYLEEILTNDLWDARARRSLAILDGKLKPDEVIDPDQLRSKAEKPEPASAKRFTCPTCGGRMTFAPNGQSLICEYCESRTRLKTGPLILKPDGEEDFIIGLAQAKGHLAPVTVHTITCQGCGATFALPAAQITQICPYCQSAYVLEQAASTEIVSPNGLIPFKIDEEQAKKILREWFAGQNFTPRPRVSRGQGLYLPVWCFDVGGQIEARYQVQMDRERWTEQSEQQVIQEQNILIPATKRLQGTLQPFYEHYDLKAVVVFDQRYLSNWLAETYQVPMSEASLDARQIALARERQKFLPSTERRYRDMRLLSSNMQVESYQLLLFPIWLAHYRLETNAYAITVNGQNGEVLAEKPKEESWANRIFKS